MPLSSGDNIVNNDVAVLGCGVLGTSLCRQYLDLQQAEETGQGGNIVGITKTTGRHESILSEVLGDDTTKNNDASAKFSVSTYEDIIASKKTYKHVVFCAPPSGFDDYPAAVADAMEKLWDKTSDDGIFCFTSSGGVYANAGQTVTELSETMSPDTSPRVARLVHAEAVCRAGNGTVLRLAGLYTLQRGAHSFYLSRDEDPRRGDGLLNSLHYDDAAGACLAAIASSSDEVRGVTMLISDGHPSTRLGVCESAVKNAAFANKSVPRFTGGDGDEDVGKVYDGSWSNELLGWRPRYSSFDAFMTG